LRCAALVQGGGDADGQGAEPQGAQAVDGANKAEALPRPRQVVVLPDDLIASGFGPGAAS
jgi:hypothetical protein